jgi:hypothetical protein
MSTPSHSSGQRLGGALQRPSINWVMRRSEQIDRQQLPDLGRELDFVANPRRDLRHARTMGRKRDPAR